MNGKFGLTAKNTYDPDHWDPSMKGTFNNADGGAATGASSTTVVGAKPGQKMQVNLSMKNNSNVALTFELFNWMNSFTKILNPNYVTGNWHYIPLLSYAGLGLSASLYDGTVGFDDLGNVLIKGAHAVPDGSGVIACSTNPYRAFYEASSIIPFSVSFIRMTFTSDEQIDNELIWFQKTFAGAYSENRVSPRAYFDPQQFQDLIVDVKAGFSVGIDAGVRVLVNAGENLRYSLFINYWTRQVI